MKKIIIQNFFEGIGTGLGIVTILVLANWLLPMKEIVSWFCR